MAGMTLTQARVQVLDHLDDETGERYNLAGDYAKVDQALASALSRCLSDYVAVGGDNFAEEAAVATSATDGTVALTSYGPIDVRHVLVDQGTSYARVRPLRRSDREFPDRTARSLVVNYVREFVLPTTAGHPLVGNGVTAANTWLAFDGWICARAALQLGIKDNELRAALAALEADCRESVKARVRLPKSADWPGPRSPWGSIIEDLRWTYLKSTTSLQLVRVRP